MLICRQCSALVSVLAGRIHVGERNKSEGRHKSAMESLCLAFAGVGMTRILHTNRGVVVLG